MASAPPALGSTVNARGVRWDLAQIVLDAAEARKRLQDLVEAAAAFQAHFEGKVAQLGPTRLLALLCELDELTEELKVLETYAELRLTADAQDAESKDLAVLTERQATTVRNALRFFELEWLLLPEEEAQELAAAPELVSYRHFLIAERRFAAHKLSAAEERVFAERRSSAQVAWQELHHDQLATLEIPFDAGQGEEAHSVDRLLSYAFHRDRSLRRRALETLYEALGGRTSVLAACYDALVADRLAEDRLRGFSDPMTPTHLANQLAPKTVELMLEATQAHEEIARRWFEAKARHLGHPLSFWDVYAPLGEPGAEVPFTEGRQVVLESLGRFSTELAERAGAFFTDERIDAEVRTGKSGGAFCAELSREVKPFMLLNYTDRLRDVTTLAHELGHGVQFELTCLTQPPLVVPTGLALAEVPSTFAEKIVFDSLLERVDDPAARLNLLAGEVERSFGAVFRQAMLARFERAAYAARKDGKALRPERLNELWHAEQAGFYGDVVSLPEWTARGWSYIPHFISTRFYTYAYTFAHLVALALYARYRQANGSFAKRYLDFLARGGSASPKEQLLDLGVDVDDPEVWEDAFAVVSKNVDAAIAALEKA